MKRLINPLPTGGVPFENEDILTLQNEGFDALKQILVGLNSPCVLSGLVVDTGGLQRVVIGGGGGSSIPTIGPGYVWIDGDIRYFPGYNYPVGSTFYIKSDILTNAKKTLQDGTLKNVYATSNAIGTTAKPTGVESITCNPDATPRLQDLITAKVAAALASEITTRQNQNTAEVTARTNADTQLNQRVSSLSDVVDTKVTKQITRVDWTDLTLNSGYSQGTSLNAGYYRPAMLRTEDGFVHLRGVVEFTINPGANTTAGTLCSLPAGFQPAKSTRYFSTGLSGDFRVAIEVSQYGIYVIPFINQTYVQTFIPPNGTNLAYSLDGIAFYTDGIGGVQ